MRSIAHQLRLRLQSMSPLVLGLSTLAEDGQPATLPWSPTPVLLAAISSVLIMALAVVFRDAIAEAIRRLQSLCLDKFEAKFRRR